MASTAPAEIDITVPTSDLDAKTTENRQSAISFDGSNVQYSADGSVSAPAPTIYQQNQERYLQTRKPVKERNLKIYKIIAIIAIIVFFPTGIPAFFMSMKLEQHYYEGINSGDMSKSIKTAALLEKLIIISFTLCLFTVILGLAIAGGTSGSLHQGVHL